MSGSRESLKNSVKMKMEMGFKEFFDHLIFGKGYFELTPPQLSAQMALQPDLLIVDLRDVRKYDQSHIEGAVSHPFDDFLQRVLMGTEYRAVKSRELVLVCDTGHQSRVAASILAEEGYAKVFSLKRGMRRWRRWQELVRSHTENQGMICCVRLHGG